MSTQTYRKVYKYPIPVADEFELSLPAGAEILHVGTQHGELMLWALVDPNAPGEMRVFRVAGTGHPITENVTHIGTVITGGDVLVWHIFEAGR